MALDLKTLGDKLSRFRHQLADSLGQVATATGIDISDLERFESGELEPTGDEILILADYYRCDYRFFISNERVAPFEQIEALYRAHGQGFSRDDRRALQEFLYLCATEEFLMQELEVPREEFQFVTTGSFYKRHADDAALQLHKFLGHSGTEVNRDVYTDFRDAGAHVFRRKLQNSRISGLFVMHPIAGKCILVNYSEDMYRQRFSAAHEMAHAVFDYAEQVSVSYVGGKDMKEVRANRFASAYLMPPELLKRLAGTAQWNESTAIRLANELRVSCDALGIALSNAGLTDDVQTERIRKCRVPANVKVDPELPSNLTQKQANQKRNLLERGLSDFYVSLCFEALAAGKISVGRLAEALLATQRETSEIATLYGRKLYVD